MAYLQDQRTYDQAADTMGAGGFNNMHVNTIKGESWFVTLGTGTTGVNGTNEDFTLEAGTYKITAYQPSYQCNSCKLRLYNVTDSTNGDVGVINYTTASTNGFAPAILQELITITKSTTYRLQFWAVSGGMNGGGASWIGSGSGNNVTTQITVEKLK